MDDYIAKPIRSNVLYETINHWAGRGGGAPQDNKLSSTEWMASSDRLDWHMAWDTVGGDLELLRELIAAFLEELPESERQLGAAVAASDAKNVRIIAHTIKGSMRYFGAKTAYDLAYKLESAAGNGTMTDAASLAASLSEELAAIRPLLRKFLREPADLEDFRSRG
jgi:HPt (histidine-containing phosphotransfer) domain-containing protein